MADAEGVADAEEAADTEDTDDDLDRPRSGTSLASAPVGGAGGTDDDRGRPCGARWTASAAPPVPPPAATAGGLTTGTVPTGAGAADGLFESGGACGAVTGRGRAGTAATGAAVDWPGGVGRTTGPR